MALKIELRGIFPSQFLLMNTSFQSELTNDDKHRSFQNFRKVPLKRAFFDYFTLEFSHSHFILPFLSRNGTCYAFDSF